jgi:energy-coupling factor transporter ATP-binding protein EcfA2
VDLPPPLTAFVALAERVRAARPRLGDTRLVCVDGPAGSGKTTFAERLAGALGPDTVVLHMDDVYAGWTLDGAVARLTAGVLRPLSEGRPGAVHRYDWAAGRFSPEPTSVPVDPWTTLRIWVEAPAELRLRRGLERDGAVLEPEWRAWQRTEAAEFAREDTRARADLRVDGAAVDGPTSFALVT